MFGKLQFSAVITALAFAAAANSRTASAEDAVSLKPKFKAGETCYVESRIDIENDMKGPMGGMKMDIKKIAGQIQKIESSTVDGVELSFAFDRMMLSLKSAMMGDLAYDSDIPSVEDAPYLKQMFDPMIGQSIRFKLDRDHKVVDVTGVDEIVKKVESAAGGNPFAMGFKQGFNKETLADMWDEMYIRKLPTTAVKPGDTWQYKGEQDLPQAGVVVKFDCICQLGKLGKHNGNNAAFVTFTGTATTAEARKGASEATPFKVEKGYQKGSYVFDLDRGMIVQEVLDMTFVIKAPEEKPDAAAGDKPAEDPAPTNPAAGMSIAMHSNSHVSVRSMDDRATEKKENDRKAAELKKKEEAEDASEDTDEDMEDDASADANSDE
ncbi:MAG TPA: DUF6263 family protein [Phycisphaerae bacterium]|nr:DUF6263 family protein [Phycisphaerae bacterium]